MSQEITKVENKVDRVYAILGDRGYITDFDYDDKYNIRALNIHLTGPIGFATLTQLQRVGKITFLSARKDNSGNCVVWLVLDIS